ncbi:MAG TPA: hypothetical protein VLC28_06790 [Flavitalea sp.]|nr:hypothetical protein [Flavitalea sp.]
MTYQEQLLHDEWAKKREEILERDNHQCVHCETERPKLVGLVKPFGINSLDELKQKGYSLFSPGESILTYDKLIFFKDNWINQATFVGDRAREFDIMQLRFALQCRKALTVFGFQKGCQLLSFYPETLSSTNLVDLNIHHRYYIFGKMAWEYNNDALISLCVECHKREHETKEIYVYNENGSKLFIPEICHRCAGSGYLKEYDYYLNGVCFQCGGGGVTGIDGKNNS